MIIKSLLLFSILNSAIALSTSNKNRSWPLKTTPRSKITLDTVRSAEEEENSVFTDGFGSGSKLPFGKILPNMTVPTPVFSFNKYRNDLSHNISNVLKGLLKNYDRRVRPNHGGPPTIITSNMHIRSMGPMSELKMEYSLDCYFRQKWQDSRLQYDGVFDSLSLNINMLEKIWKPDTYFHNGKGSYLHTITRPNKFLRIYKTGQVYYSMRFTVKAKCSMQLHSFPMDKQSCPLVFGSYGYTMDDLRYQWEPVDPVSKSSDMLMSQFDFIESPWRNDTSYFKRGRYSVLQVNFNLRRHTGYFLIQVYVPCALIVVLSWVSFWINREATADRVGLGITSVLTLSTFGMDTRTDLPKVSYPTALDWFTLMCFSFVIFTILEFAGVHYFTKVGYGEVPLIEIDEEWEEEGLSSDNENPVHIIAPPKSFTGSETQENQYYTTKPVRKKRRFRKSRAIIATDYPARHLQEFYNDPNYCPKHDRFVYPSVYEGNILATMQMGSGESQSDVGNFADDDEYEDCPTDDTASQHESENTNECCFCSLKLNLPKCCSQFYHCVIGSEEYRHQMKSRRPSGRGVVNSVSKIDKVSRILFPFSFAILNLFYWMFYFSERNAPFD